MSRPPGPVVFEPPNPPSRIVPGGIRNVPPPQASSEPPKQELIRFAGRSLLAAQSDARRAQAHLPPEAYPNPMRRRIHTLRSPNPNVQFAAALSAGPSNRPDAPMPDVRLPVATCPAPHPSDARSSIGAPCRIAPPQQTPYPAGVGRGRPPPSGPNNTPHMSQIPAGPPGFHAATARPKISTHQPSIYQNAPKLAPPGYYPGPLDPASGLKNINATNPVHLPVGSYYRYYQILETQQKSRKIEAFLTRNDIQHEIAQYPIQYPTVRDVLVELEDLKEKMRINLVQERLYRDTEVKCLRGILELTQEHIESVEEQSERHKGFNQVNFVNHNQTFLQFMHRIKGRIDFCLSHVKTDLHIPVDLKAPEKPYVPRRRTPLIRQYQLQKDKPNSEEVGISAEELMRMADLDYAQAEANRRKEIVSREYNSAIPSINSLNRSNRIYNKRRKAELNNAIDQERSQSTPSAAAIPDDEISSSSLHIYRDPERPDVKELHFMPLIDVKPDVKQTSEQMVTSKKGKIAVAEEEVASGEMGNDDMEIFVDIEDDEESVNGIDYPRQLFPQITPPAAPVIFPSATSKVNEMRSTSSTNGEEGNGLTGSEKRATDEIPERVILAMQTNISFLQYPDLEWLKNVKNPKIKKKVKALHDQIDWKEYTRLQRIIDRAIVVGKIFSEERLNSIFNAESLKKRPHPTADQPHDVNSSHSGDANSEPQTCSSSEVSLSNQWQENATPSHSGSTPSQTESKMSITEDSKLAQLLHSFESNVVANETKDTPTNVDQGQARPTLSFNSNIYPKKTQEEPQSQYEYDEFTGGEIRCELCQCMTMIRDLKDLVSHASVHVERVKRQMRLSGQGPVDESQINGRAFVQKCFPSIALSIFDQLKERAFLNRSALTKKRRVSKPHLETPYPCQECGEILYIQRGLNVDMVCAPLVAHLSEKHGDICTPHRCEECGYINPHEWIIRLHITVRHPEKTLSMVPVSHPSEDHVILFVRDMFMGIEKIIGERIDEEEAELVEIIGKIQFNGLTAEGLQRPPGGERRSEIPVKTVEEENPVDEPHEDVSELLDPGKYEAPDAKAVPKISEELDTTCKVCSKSFDPSDDNHLSNLINHAKSHLRIKEFECSAGDYGHSSQKKVDEHVREKGEGHTLQVHNNEFMHTHWRRMMQRCFSKLPPDMISFQPGYSVPCDESKKLLDQRRRVVKRQWNGRILKRGAEAAEAPPPTKKSSSSLDVSEPGPSSSRRYSRRLSKASEPKEENADTE